MQSRHGEANGVSSTALSHSTHLGSHLLSVSLVPGMNLLTELIWLTNTAIDSKMGLKSVIILIMRKNLPSDCGTKKFYQ